MIEMPTNTKPLWLQGDVLERLADIPDDSIQCCISSPPYWGLRKYIDDNSPEKEFEIGLEPTLTDWLDKMVKVFREVKRVLRPDGCMFLNCGDAYIGPNNKASGVMAYKYAARGTDESTSKVVPGLKPKQLILMPARLALALQSAGWWIRSEIIWFKKNAMPESATDRPGSCHEKIYLMSKEEEPYLSGTIYLVTENARYFYDADAIREPGSKDSHGGGQCHEGRYSFQSGRNDGGNEKFLSAKPAGESGRNARNVWTIPTHGNPLAHFATFPPELVRRCIAAGTSQEGCCKKCGKPWIRVTEKTIVPTAKAAKTFVVDERDINADSQDQGSNRQKDGHKPGYITNSKTLGFRPGCDCDARYPTTRPCIILDPFAGIGTTLAVATRMGRASIGIELNPDYIRDGLPDVEAAFKGITRKEVEAGQEILFE